MYLCNVYNAFYFIYLLSLWLFSSRRRRCNLERVGVVHLIYENFHYCIRLWTNYDGRFHNPKRIINHNIYKYYIFQNSPGCTRLSEFFFFTEPINNIAYIRALPTLFAFFMVRPMGGGDPRDIIMILLLNNLMKISNKSCHTHWYILPGTLYYVLYTHRILL